MPFAVEQPPLMCCPPPCPAVQANIGHCSRINAFVHMQSNIYMLREMYILQPHTGDEGFIASKNTILKCKDHPEMHCSSAPAAGASGTARSPTAPPCDGTAAAPWRARRCVARCAAPPAAHPLWRLHRTFTIGSTYRTCQLYRRHKATDKFTARQCMSPNEEGNAIDDAFQKPLLHRRPTKTASGG